MGRRPTVSFALNDPAMAFVDLFLLMPKKALKDRPKLDLTQTFKEVTISWRGPDRLSIPEQTVWLTLVALAAAHKTELKGDTDGGVEVELLTRLKLEGRLQDESAAVIQCSWSNLARACGYRSTARGMLNQLKASVQRLSEVVVWCEHDDIKTCTHLLSWLAGDDRHVYVALNWRIGRILFGNAQYARVCLDERRQLDTDAAKALHAFLSTRMRQEDWKGRRFALDTLAQHLFGDAAEGAKARDRRRRVRLALNELNRLAGWIATESGDVATIKRSSRNNAHATYQNAHSSLHASDCFDKCIAGDEQPPLRGSTNRVEGSPADGGPRRLEAPPVPFPRSPRMGGETAQAPAR